MQSAIIKMIHDSKDVKESFNTENCCEFFSGNVTIL